MLSPDGPPDMSMNPTLQGGLVLWYSFPITALWFIASVPSFHFMNYADGCVYESDPSRWARFMAPLHRCGVMIYSKCPLIFWQAGVFVKLSRGDAGCRRWLVALLNGSWHLINCTRICASTSHRKEPNTRRTVKDTLKGVPIGCEMLS